MKLASLNLLSPFFSPKNRN